MPLKTRMRAGLAPSLLLLLSSAGTSFAQDRRPLPIEDYDRWRSIESVALSPDGQWLTFAYGHRVIEDTLQIRSLDDERLYTIRGAAGPVV